MTQESRWLQAAVLLPLLGLLALIARAEISLRSGASFIVPIKGYDPRDLLHGHYLQYSFDFDWQGDSTCGSLRDGKPIDFDPSCCVCLGIPPGVKPPAPARARQVRCDQVGSCSWLDGAAIAPPLRYFVSERHAVALEEALRDRPVALGVTCGPNGQPAIGELYIEGLPWREFVGER